MLPNGCDLSAWLGLDTLVLCRGSGNKGVTPLERCDEMGLGKCFYRQESTSARHHQPCSTGCPGVFTESISTIPSRRRMMRSE